MKTLSILAYAMAIMAAILPAMNTAFAADDEADANVKELAVAVKKAIDARDAAALDKLVYWDGASEGGKKFFKNLLAVALEIAVDKVEIGLLPKDKSGPPTTLTVTHLLMITGKPGDAGPTRQVFPVGEKDGKLYLAASKDSPLRAPAPK